MENKYVIYRRDFMGKKEYIKGFSMTYNLEDANKFNTQDQAKDALKQNILHRIDFNLSNETLNKFMSHYKTEQIEEWIKNRMLV